MFFRLKKVSLLLLVLLLTSCARPAVEPGAGNKAEYAVPTYTPRPIPTPLPKNESGEPTLLLRKNIEPYEVVVLRLSTGCLLNGEECNMKGNLLGVLPQSLSQVLKIYWMSNGDKAFFRDNMGDIYVLDGNQGTFQIFKKQVLKVRDVFLISPNGQNTIFETQNSDYETDLVLMDNLSGDISKIDILLPGAKYASQWIDDHTVLFFNELSEGKGYIIDRRVYTLNTIEQSVQPLDIDRDWMRTSVPVFSPDSKYMAFTTEDGTVLREASNASEHTLAMSGKNFLWSLDSNFLVIYDSNRQIYTVLSNGSGLQKVYSLASIENLEDWLWLPDNIHILLILTDDDGNRQVGILSVLDQSFSQLNLSLLQNYEPISVSYRP